MSDKDFKVKSNLVVGGLTIAGPIVRHTDGTLTSHTTLPLDKGGTGQTTAANSLNALLPVQTSLDGYYLKTDGTNASWSTVTAGFTPVPSTAISSNVTLAAFNKYFVDTTAARTITLPASPTLGAEIYIFDASGTAATYNITIARNGEKINGNAGNLIFNVNGGAASLVYTGSTYGWRVG
jgi:hypothetical protein